MQKFIIRVDVENMKILENITEECYVLNAQLSEEYCRLFAAKISEEGKILLFYGEDAVKKAKVFGADGVILDLGSEALKNKIADVRKELGKDSIVGLFTRNRRHESMLVSEVEPDFIIFKVWKDGFDGVKELLDWYNDFFLIQSAAWIMDNDVDLSELKTDFIIR